MDRELTLQHWLAGLPRPVRPYYGVTGAVAIPDTNAIAHTRTYLWALADYRVSSVTGGSIWLVPVNQNGG